jgi:hypothetical protein
MVLLALLALLAGAVGVLAQGEARTPGDAKDKPEVVPPMPPVEAPQDARDSRRGKRDEYYHEDSGQHFTGPRRWAWHDPENHFKVNKLCYPPDAKTYLPAAILRVKPLDPGVTFPMIVDYAWYRLKKLVDVDKVLVDAPSELPFENQGVYVMDVTGTLRGIEVRCRQVVYLRGKWFTVIACGSRVENFDDNVGNFTELIDSITFDGAPASDERN